nr:integrase, catalytic region, zinc finger, CCHC-type, peptidase aspartic, catalytic [Tanacetum cinerariifolium]
MAEKKVITKTIDYVVLNQLSKDFKTRFVPQTELSAEQGFWSCYSVQPEEPNLSAVEQHCVEKNKFQDKMKNVLKENDRLLTQALSVDIMNIVVHDHVKSACMNVNRNTLFSQESAPMFAKLFEINDLKAQSQAKDTVILKLKEKLQSLSGDVKERKVKREIEEIKTLNIELGHRVTKLVAENKHLKQTYKKLYDSIKPSRVRSKEKSLKESFSKLKGKDVVNEAVPLHTIDLELLKIDVAPLAPKLRKNRTVHTDYIRHTLEEAATLREIVESERLINPLNTSLDYDSKQNKLEEHLRKVRPSLNKKSVVDTKATSSVTNSMSNVNSDLQCASCNSCLFSDNHDACVVAYINYVNASIKSKSVKKPVNRIIWQPIGRMFTTVGHRWTPTGRTFTLVGNVCPLTRLATTTIVPPREPIPIVSNTYKPVIKLVYSRKSKATNKRVPVSNSTMNKSLVVQIGLWYLDSGYSKHMTGHRSQLINYVQKFLGTVKFENDHVEKIMGYGDYQIGNMTISWVYYMEGLGHNLFSMGQFCVLDLEVAFRQHTGFIRNLDGVDLLTACAMGKSMKKSHKPKSEDTNQEKLYLLHMDLCRPIRVESVNEKKYILVIVDDYSRFTRVKFLRSKDEALDFIIKFLRMIQVRLKVPVRRIQTDNGTEFVNQSLRDYYEEVGISHETSVARSPQQNGVVERRNRTLIEAARTMLIYTQAPLFLWVEAVATACFTQNRSIIRLQHGNTPYDLLHNKLPDLSFFHVFGALCYPTNDSENLGKLQPKADIRVFIHYALTKKAFRIYTGAQEELLKQYINDWDLLFQPMFDELLNPPPSVVHQAPEVIAPIGDVIPLVQDDSTGSPSSTTVGQDAPSASKSHTTTEIQSSVSPQEVKEDNLDIEVAHMRNDPLLGVPIIEVTSAQSSSTTYKDALTQSCWIEAMQEELNEFERIEVLELVPRPDKVMISQSPRSIFINQSKYALESLKKYGFESYDPVDTPMVEKSKLDEDKEGKVVDPSHYRGMIGTLLYLTASRPDLQFAICMCARYQVRPTEKHVHAVKRIFRYLRGTVHRGLWYPKDSFVALIAFADADHVGCQDICHTTSGSV